MIIEIKDLPPGRKVNRILVDITFEESGQDGLEPATEPSSNVSNQQSKSVPDLGDNNTKVTAEAPQSIAPEPEIPYISKPSMDVDREPRSIPPEMLDMEL